MFIGEFCKLTGTTPKTIRYYESLGLLPVSQRQGKYRIYDDTYVETVRQIKLAQQYGFKLSELKALCEGQDIRRGLPANVILQAITDKREAIDEEVARLTEVSSDLAKLQKALNNSPCFVDSALKVNV